MLLFYNRTHTSVTLNLENTLYYKFRRDVFVLLFDPLYGMNNYVLIWGDWLLCDPLRRSHDSQSPHIWGDWLLCDPLRRSHDSRSPHIKKHMCPILWQLLFICHKFIHTI